MAKLVGNAFTNLLEARCDTCKHWGDDTADEDTNFRCCEILSLNRPEGAAGFYTGSNRATLPTHIYTGSDFGCVRWETKESEQLAGKPLNISPERAKEMANQIASEVNMRRIAREEIKKALNDIARVATDRRGYGNS